MGVISHTPDRSPCTTEFECTSQECYFVQSGELQHSQYCRPEAASLSYGTNVMLPPATFRKITYQSKDLNNREFVMVVLQITCQSAVLYPRAHHGRESTESGSSSKEWQDIPMLQGQPNFDLPAKPL